MRKLLIALALPAILLTMNACNQNKIKGDNPFMTEWDTPFGVPPFDKITPADYTPALVEAMARHTAEIDSIAGIKEPATFDNSVLAFDNSGEMLDRVWRTFSLVAQAVNGPEMQAIEEDMTPKLSAHNDGILLDERLFARIKTVYESRASLGDEMKIRLTEKVYDKFVRAGALLSPKDKELLKGINERLASQTFKFGANLLAANGDFLMLLDEADLEGLPENLKTAAAEKAEAKGHAGKWAFTLDKPTLLPFITYSTRRDLRQQLYEGYLNRCNYGDGNDNKEVINELISLREQKAKLLGYDTFAAFVLDEQMAKTPANVYNLLDQLWTPALNCAKAELDEMTALLRADGIQDEFRSWDWWYYAEKVRQNKYDLNEEMLRPYFSLDNVRAGIFNLSNRLYGITFRPVNIPTYHPEATAWEVLDRDLSHLGILYLDFHPRAGEKRGGAWFDEFRIQSYKDSVKVSPITYIVCNFTRPVGSQPALLDLDETSTFFHEFGHALHHLFIDVPYRGLHDVERDFVELPSQLLENWAFEPAVLRTYATHYSSGAVIPDYLITKIQNSSLFNQGFINTEKIAASYSDMDIHSRTETGEIDVNAFEKQALNEKRGLIPQIEPRYRYPYFSHIFDGGYSAGYYSYIWSEVLDKDTFAAFVESGDIFNPDLAKRLRDELLSKGGSADGMTLYKNFRGHEPSMEPLLKARGLMQ